MNKIAIIIGLLLATYSSYAQNWAPFTQGESHHFRSDTGTWIDRTIRIDSVTHDVNGPIWHFPRLLTVLNDDHALTNVPHFCQRTLRPLGNGSYRFLDPGDFTLDVWAHLGGMALQSVQGISGVVTRADVGIVLGEPDSVKVISLTTNDSLVLSKEHGLVEWPASLSGMRYRLVGMQEKHLGDTLPGFDGFYPYKLGDVFCWRAGGSSYDHTRPLSQQGPPWYVRWKVKVISALRDTTGLHMVLATMREYEDYSAVRDTMLYYLPDTGTGLHLVGPGEMVKVGPWLAPSFFPSGFSVWDALSVDLHHSLTQPFAAAQYHHRQDTTILSFLERSTHEFWHTPVGAPVSDTLESHYLAGEDFEIAEGLGFTRSFSRGLYTTRTETWTIRMQGYVIDGDTVGTVWPDFEPLPPPSGSPDLWPNPTTGVFHFDPKQTNAVSVQVVDMLGRLVMRQAVRGEVATFDASLLRPGLYLVGTAGAPKGSYLKLVVMH